MTLLYDHGCEGDREYIKKMQTLFLKSYAKTLKNQDSDSQATSAPAESVPFPLDPHNVGDATDDASPSVKEWWDIGLGLIKSKKVI
jgi:hypothetical protein